MLTVSLIWLFNWMMLAFPPLRSNRKIGTGASFTLIWVISRLTGIILSLTRAGFRMTRVKFFGTISLNNNVYNQFHCYSMPESKLSRAFGDSRNFLGKCLLHAQRCGYNAHAKPCTSKKKSTCQNELSEKQATMFNEQPTQWPPYVENNSGILINTIEETHYWRRRNTKYSQEVWFGGRVSMKL